MVRLKTEEEIELIRQSSLLVGKTLAEVAKAILPGVTTNQLDAIAEKFIMDNGGRPGFKGYNGFPNTLCTSVNNAVVHGIPNSTPLKEGDVVSVDCGVLMNGYYGDSAYTFAVGDVAGELLNLLEVTKSSLYLGIEKAVEGNRMGEIGYAIQAHAESHGYGVVRELVGHGLGKSLHEAPEVPNYGRRGVGVMLKSGMVLAIEPMINADSRKIREAEDGWTIVTADGKPSAHYEHTIVVRKGRAEVLSTFEYVEEILKNK
jgi:methionyl aminopeptidase